MNISQEDLDRLISISKAAYDLFDQKVSPNTQSPPVEKWIALRLAFDGNKCGNIGKSRCGEVTAVCQLKKGHSGNHGGMGCEWKLDEKDGDRHSSMNNDDIM